jgi:hypothetical protein
VPWELVLQSIADTAARGWISRVVGATSMVERIMAKPGIAEMME